jgi:hypothetical protein
MLCSDLERFIFHSSSANPKHFFPWDNEISSRILQGVKAKENQCQMLLNH